MMLMPWRYLLHNTPSRHAAVLYGITCMVTRMPRRLVCIAQRSATAPCPPPPDATGNFAAASLLLVHSR